MFERIVLGRNPNPEMTAMASRLDASFVAPAVDIVETDDALTFVADLPGARRIDLEIRFEDDVLTIRGLLPESADECNAPGAVGFFQELELSHPVDVDRASAALECGVLRLCVPRVNANRRRRLDVRAATGSTIAVRRDS